MLLNKQIGCSYHEDGSIDYSVEYIDGARFQEELMQLDEMGKKRICLYITSEGGNVTDAMKICSAVLQSKTPVDTYNTGICASAAGWIWACGRKRYMNDYALLMMHPVSGGDKGSDAITNSIATILASNSTLTENQYKYMMAVTTWASASECFDNGLCTDIIATKDSNKKYMPTSNMAAMLAYSNMLTQEMIDNLKTPTMDLKTITNKLNLVEGADLAQINNAIDVIVSGKTELQKTVNSLTAELEAEKQAATEANNKVDELQAQVDAANAEKEAAQAAAAEIEATNKATELVNQFKNRIGANTEVWINKAKTNYDETKALLESLAINSQGQKITTQNSGTGLNVQAIMNKIAEKTSNQ